MDLNTAETICIYCAALVIICMSLGFLFVGIEFLIERIKLLKQNNYE